MEGSAKRLKALRQLRERLHTETEPDKVYKTLKKLSKVPILCDTLAEIGFRQTIELLRREQLLVPFAKDLAAKWSERSPLERQAEAEPQDLASQMRPTREQAPRKPAAEDEAHEPAASRARAGDARQVVGGSRRSPQRTPDSYPPGSFEACLNYDYPSSSSTLPLGKGNKRKRPWKAETQSHGAKVPRSESPNCKEQSALPASRCPEQSSSRQACLTPDGQDSSSLQCEQEAAPFACRVNSKTPVYSGRAPGPLLLPKLHQGCLAKPNCSSQPAEAQEEECRPQICQTTQAQAERQTHLQQQEAHQLMLQGLRERLQRAQAKKSQARQTKMIPFPAQVASQSQQQAASGHAGGGGSPSKENKAPDPQQKAPLGPRNQTQLKKSAPLMAKSLRDYKNRYSRR